MRSPWLSVIMPVYNGSRYVARALASVAEQSDPGIEVIVIDDGSSDDTVAIASTFASTLQLQIVRREHCGNWVTNTNLGFSLTAAPFASILHQDDYWLPNRVRTLQDVITRTPDVDLVLTASRFVDAHGRSLGAWTCPLRSGVQSRARLLSQLIVQNFIALPAPVFRLSNARAIGLLDTSLWYTADWDLWLKVAQTGTVVYEPTATVAFRVHSASQTVAGLSRGDDMLRQQEEVLSRHLPLIDQSGPDGKATVKVAKFSARLNHMLGKLLTGSGLVWLPLVREFVTLGPRGWRRYVRDSRIVERLASRLKATRRRGWSKHV